MDLNLRTCRSLPTSQHEASYQALQRALAGDNPSMNSVHKQKYEGEQEEKSLPCRKNADLHRSMRDAENVGKENESRNLDILPGAIKTVWPPWKRNDGWSGWMSDTVTSKALVLCLILQAFSTGILDATTYLDFSTFASNQTGNTILLTVAVVRVSGHQLLLTGVSLASFLSAALVFGHIGHFMGVRRRIWLLINVICQIVFLILAAIFLSPSGGNSTRLGRKHEWVIISLFALMSGAQVAAARQASVQEIPTAPMTSSYVDLVADKYLFAGFNNENATGRNKRLVYILSVIIGSFIGSIMHKYAGSWVVVVIAMAFKLAVIVLMSLAATDEKVETHNAC
ncbi:uncharacterized protein IL334_001010 [Kwoniella shivajii]|uniref:DUF1275 domain protein n=1 Tax=Kwoniella shivajii TaxID=564305 RepID=A0ABZ1CRU1_9TREE|nr:hypothetical protein IL334_001010 [Kwoniella shivajii]